MIPTPFKRDIFLEKSTSEKDVREGRGDITYRSAKLACPIMVELDRILVTTDWEANFPLCIVHSLIRVGSDHSPLVLDSRDKNRMKLGRFYFENKWFC